MRALFREPRWLLKLVSATYLHNEIRRVCSARERDREGSSKKNFLLVCLLSKRKKKSPPPEAHGRLPFQIFATMCLHCQSLCPLGFVNQKEEQFRGLSPVPCRIIYQTLLTPQERPYLIEGQMVGWDRERCRG